MTCGIARVLYCLVHNTKLKWRWAVADGWKCLVHYLLPNRSNGMVVSVRDDRKTCSRFRFVVYACVRHEWSKCMNVQIEIEGWFVGIDWPSMLLLRKCNMKVVAVSRRKVVFY